MGRGFVVGIVVFVGVTVSACGGSGLSGRPAAPAGATSQTSQAAASSNDLVCYPSAASAGCPLETPAVDNAAWSRVWNAPVQAALLEMTEEQYATCYSYATLDRDVVTTTAASAPIGAACSTSGLTPTEAKQIQGLIEEST